MYTYYMYECVYTTTKRILCVHCTYLQVSTIVQHGCIGPMCNLINDRQKEVIVEIILNGLENCLKHVEIAFKIFEESGAIDKIKQLKNHCSIGIAEAADTLLKVYFRGYVSIEFSHVDAICISKYLSKMFRSFLLLSFYVICLSVVY